MPVLKYYTVTIRATDCDIALVYKVAARTPMKAENLVRHDFYRKDQKDFGPINSLKVSRGRMVRERILEHN